jgi:hypothetical protein
MPGRRRIAERAAACPAGFALALAAACSTDVGERACPGDNACPSGTACVGGLCRDAECRDDAGCASDHRCDRAARVCRPAVCRDDADCAPGRRCSSGQCLEPAEAARPVRCFVTTPALVLREGQRVTFTAVAVTRAGVLARDHAYRWSSSSPDVATIDDGGEAAGGAQTGVTSITARLAELPLTCDAAVPLRNYGRAPPGARVVVVDARTARPVEGAVVLADNFRENTNSDGVAIFADFAIPGQRAWPDAVHMMHADYDYLSIVAPGAADLLVPLMPRARGDAEAGLTGAFAGAGAPGQAGAPPAAAGDLWLGLAGAALNEGPIGLDLDALAGPPVRAHVAGRTSLLLPGGLVLALGGDVLAASFRRVAPAGARLVWGLGGPVPVDVGAFEALQPLLAGLSAERIRRGEALMAVLPLLAGLPAAWTGPVDLVAWPRVPDVDDLDGDGATGGTVPDFAAFPRVELTPRHAPSRSARVLVPAPPSAGGGERLDQVIGVAGVHVPSRGMVVVSIAGLRVAAPVATPVPPEGGAAVAELSLGLPSEDGAPFLGLDEPAARAGHEPRWVVALLAVAPDAAPGVRSVTFIRPAGFEGALYVGPFPAPPAGWRWRGAERRLMQGDDPPPATPANDGSGGGAAPGLLRVRFVRPDGAVWEWLLPDAGEGIAAHELPRPPEGLEDRAVDGPVAVEALRPGAADSRADLFSYGVPLVGRLWRIVDGVAAASCGVSSAACGIE